MFSGPDPARVIYVGSSTSNLHQIVRDQTSNSSLHFQYPSIKPTLPWKPNAIIRGSSTHFDNLDNLLPKHLQDCLLETYFEDIHPYMPIIERTSFQKQHNGPKDPPPLLLLQSMFLASARISDHPEIASARTEITDALFTSAKALFDMRHENDRTTLVQSALLLAWHVENSDTVSGNAYHWIGQATRVAFGLGMHRDLGPNSQTTMPASDKHMYRKLWWAIVQAETFLSLEYGRPSMIRLEDFDQTPLTQVDFTNSEGVVDESACEEFIYTTHELSLLALDVLALARPNAEPGNTSGFDAKFTRIGSHLPFNHSFGACQLRITYNFLIIMYHRASTICSADAVISCREAASCILTTFETMLANGSIRKSNFFASAAIFTAAIQFVKEAQLGISEATKMRTLSAHAQLDRLLRPLKALTAYWPNMTPYTTSA